MLSPHLLLHLAFSPIVVPAPAPETEREVAADLRSEFSEAVESWPDDGGEDQEVAADLQSEFPAVHRTSHDTFVPEPAVFDLVRGLGAAAGELEVNSLFVMGMDSGELRWAPEVEWAFADGYAVELELPMVDREVDALKLALQGTLPLDVAGIRHGWQVFGEVSMRAPDVDAVAVYLVAARWSRGWSALGMLGAKASVPSDTDPFARGILNLSVFYDASKAVTLGLEGNTLLGEGDRSVVRLVPQAHWQVGERLRLQIGGGVEWTPGGLEPVAVLRAVLE